MPTALFRYLAVWILIFSASILSAQSPGDTPSPPVPTASERMESLLEGTRLLNENAAALRNANARLPVNDPKCLAQEAELASLEARIAEQEAAFVFLATGIDHADEKLSASGNGSALDWNTELRDAFSPLLRELKQIGERPRKFEALTSALEATNKRIAVTQKAVGQLERTMAALPAGRHAALRKKLTQEDLPRWQALLKEEQNRAATLTQQLEARKNDSTSLWSSLWSSLKEFILNRGRSIFLTVIGFIATLFAFRGMRKLWTRYCPSRYRRMSPSLRRVASLAWQSAALGCSIFVALAVLYASGDWVLLALSLLLLAGFALAARHGGTAPPAKAASLSPAPQQSIPPTSQLN